MSNIKISLYCYLKSLETFWNNIQNISHISHLPFPDMFLVSFHPEQSHPNISRWSRGKQTLVWVGRSTVAQNRGEGQLCQESAWCRCQNLRGWGDEALAASVWCWGSECRQVRKAVPQMTDWAWHQSPSRVRSVNAGEWPIMLCRRHSAWGACLNHVLKKTNKFKLRKVLQNNWPG